MFSERWPRKFCSETFLQQLQKLNTNAKIHVGYYKSKKKGFITQGTEEINESCGRQVLKNVEKVKLPRQNIFSVNIQKEFPSIIPRVEGGLNVRVIIIIWAKFL